MHRPLRSFLFAVLLGSGLVVGAALAAAGDAAREDGFVDSLGPLARDQSAATVQKALGAPGRKNRIQEEGATGDFVQNWVYPKLGLVLMMRAPTAKGRQTVGNITVKAPCPFTTPRGIGIGSTAAEVLRAYPREVDPAQKGPERILLGTDFFGVSFKLQAGKVVEIFIGAAAE